MSYLQTCSLTSSCHGYSCNSSEIPPTGWPALGSGQRGLQVWLVHTLMPYAEVTRKGNPLPPCCLVNHAFILFVLQAGTMCMALGRGIRSITRQANDLVDAGALEMHFYETWPNLKFAHINDLELYMLGVQPEEEAGTSLMEVPKLLARPGAGEKILAAHFGLANLPIHR